MGSILKLYSIGINTGPRIKVAEIMSINMPTIRKIIFMTSKNSKGECITFITREEMRNGIFSRVKNLPKHVAPATIIKRVAEVTAELTVISFTSLKVIAL